MKAAFGYSHIFGTRRIFGRTLEHPGALLASSILAVGFCKLGTSPLGDFRMSPRGLPGGRNQLQRASSILIEVGRKTFCTDGYRGSHIAKPSTLIFWLRSGFPRGCLRPDIFEWDQSSLALGLTIAPLLVRRYSGDRGIQYSLSRVG